MHVAAVQMVSGPDVAHNLASAAALIAEAAQSGAKLVALPEYFCLMGQRDADKLAIAESPGSGPIQDALSEAASAHGVCLVAGTLPLRSGHDPQRVRNACCVYGPDGRMLARYDKRHLFCFDNGQERYDEGQVLEAGTDPVAFALDAWRIGLGICYDLRFPEHFRALMQPPCDLLIVPAAFTDTTGRAHWELLLRARAVENQCYVVAPAQGGLHANGRRTFGHSLIIDPWGEIVAVRKTGPGLVLAQIDLARIAAVRTQLPALAHRKF
jgi:deaminated glutathione amidase